MLAAVCCFALAMQQEEPLPAVKAKPALAEPATETAAPPVVPRKIETPLPPVKALNPRPPAPPADAMALPPAPPADTMPLPAPAVDTQPLPPAPIPETDDPRRGMFFLAAIALLGVGVFALLIRRRSEPVDAPAIESPGSDASQPHFPSSPDHSHRDEDVRGLRR